MHMPCPVCYDRKNYRLTGRVEFSRLMIGRWKLEEFVRLRVEEAFDEARYTASPRSYSELTYETKTRWRDATAFDLATIPLRWLVDAQPKEATA